MKKIGEIIMKKKLLLIFLSLALAAGILSGCRSQSEENEDTKPTETAEHMDIKVGAPSGAPTLSLIKMFEENPSLGQNVDVSYESIAATDALSAKLISEELDMAVVPTNLAASIYNKGLPYKLVGSNVWGLLYLASSEEISDWDDLRGKEIYTMGRGLTPDIVFRYLLEENGIDPEKDVTLNYLGGGSELASTVISGQGSVALIPEPMLSKVLIKRTDMKLSLDMQEEWSKATGQDSSYPQASIIAKTSIIDSRPEVLEAFLKLHSESIEWVNTNPEEAGVLSEKIQPDMDAKTVVAGIERINMNYVGAADAKTSVQNYLKVLFDYSPESVGGSVPDENFYYESK